VLATAFELLTSEDLSLSELAHRLHEEGYTAHRVHRTTLGRWVKQHAQSKGLHLRALTGKPRPVLSEANKQARLKFASRNRFRDWSRVMFTDRKKFLLRSPGSAVRPVTWTTGDRSRAARFVTRPVAVNVYAGLTARGMTLCHFVTGTAGLKTTYNNKKGQPSRNITAAEYGDVVKKTLLPEGDRLFSKGGSVLKWVLQQDNDPCHGAAASPVESWGRQHSRSVSLLKDWPPNSPDLNIVENVWSIVDAKLKARVCRNAAEFQQAVVEELASVPQAVISKLFQSLPKRLEEVTQLGYREAEILMRAHLTILTLWQST
jgi:hypothetical protein